MTFVDWVSEKLTMRVIMGDCFINIDGETHSAKVNNPEDIRYITVEYTNEKNVNHELKIYLGSITTFDGWMYHFDHSAPEGKNGTLVIPHFGNEDEDEED